MKLFSIVFLLSIFNCVYGKIDWRDYSTEIISNVAGPLIHINALCHEDLCCEFEVNGSISENVVNHMVCELSWFVLWLKII